MFFWLNLLVKGSTQIDEAHPDTVFEGLETRLTTKTTRNRLRKGMTSNSRITIATCIV